MSLWFSKILGSNISVSSKFSTDDFEISKTYSKGSMQCKNACPPSTIILNFFPSFFSFYNLTFAYFSKSL